MLLVATMLNIINSRSTDTTMHNHKMITFS